MALDFDFLLDPSMGGLTPDEVDVLGEYGMGQGGEQAAPQGFMDKASSLLRDPNVIMALGELGAIGGKGSVGQIAGEAGKQLSRRRAVQKAGAEQIGRGRTFQDRILQMAAKGDLLSDPTDNTRPDSLTIDGKGNLSLKAGMSDSPNYLGEQTPLESQRPQRSSTYADYGLDDPMAGGRSDLRDFMMGNLG